MEDILTRYGTLYGAVCHRTYENGFPREVKLSRENRLNTSVGEIIPHYRAGSHSESDILFYPDGSIKYVCLMESVKVDTPIGIVPCNSLMFYEDSSLKHAFIRDALELDAIGAEDIGDDESINIKMEHCDLAGKITGISFYHSGAVKMITIAACESIMFNTSIGSLRIRNSISFYENGMVKALEPARPLAVDTPLGFLKAYNPLANSGDVINSSLRFSENGNVSSLVTVNNTICVMVGNNEFLFEPSEIANSYFHELSDIAPIEIKFYNSSLAIADRGKKYLFDLGRCVFDIFSYEK